MASSSMTRKDNKGQRQESIEEYKIEAWKLVNWVQKEKKKCPGVNGVYWSWHSRWLLEEPLALPLMCIFAISALALCYSHYD